MGRLLSLLLFGLLLYNMMGYSVVYLLEDNHTVSEGHKDYIEKKAFSNDIVIKVPVSVPYQVSWDSSEPTEGQIQHEGEHYQMKTRQLINDTMYVHCEVDQNARDRYSELVSKIQDEITGGQPQKSTPSKVLKHFLKEFLAVDRKHVFYLLEWLPANKSAPDRYLGTISNNILNIPSPPPDQV